MANLFAHSDINKVVLPSRYYVKLTWDNEAEVWIATSDEVHGLVLEAASIDEVIQKTVQAVPELVKLNGLQKKQDIHFVYDRLEKVTFV